MALTALVLKAGLKTAGGFLFAKWKMIAIGLLVTVIFSGVLKVYGVFKDRDALLEEREGKITRLVKENTEAEIAKQTAEETIRKMVDDNIRIDKIYDEIVDLQTQIGIKFEEQTKIFEDHDFTKLSNAKPGLIIKPINAKTKERLNELEDSFNQ